MLIFQVSRAWNLRKAGLSSSPPTLNPNNQKPSAKTMVQAVIESVRWIKSFASSVAPDSAFSPGSPLTSSTSEFNCRRNALQEAIPNCTSASPRTGKPIDHGKSRVRNGQSRASQTTQTSSSTRKALIRTSFFVRDNRSLSFLPVTSGNHFLDVRPEQHRQRDHDDDQHNRPQ